MKKYLYLTFFILTACFSVENDQNKSFTDFVNPFIGTDGTGNTYPGSTTPFGMVQLSPDIGIAGWDRISGYFYQDSIITGFSHTHLSGTGAGDLYDILFMPTNSRYNKKIAENNFKPFSHFSHRDEKAKAGYYSVILKDFGIKVELTTTPRVGIQKYTFPKDENSKITLDLGYSINWDEPTETYIKVVDSVTIEGYRHSTGWAKDQKVFFVSQFSKPFKNFKLFKNNEEISSEKEIKSTDTRIVLKYGQTTDNEEIIIKTALSSADISGAYANLKAETEGFNFEDFKEKNNLLWDKELSKIQIKTSSEDEKIVFYTMLYQSMIAPTLFSDVDGRYKGVKGEVLKMPSGNRYDTFSLWDTYRAAHPLYNIIHPKKNAEFIASFLEHYKETGLLPVWSMQGNETNMMIGAHAVPIIVDAFFKGTKIDTLLAYNACKESLLDTTRELDLYQDFGFIPYDLDTSGENWSVSKTLEYAYDDWCFAQFAKALNNLQDYQSFLKRSENWRNLFDDKTKFFRPKDSKGEFIKKFNPKEYTKYFCESNAWQYRWDAKQNIPELILAMGGQDEFEQKLDSMFSFASTSDEKLPIFSTGMIGQYVHGNEPSHHIAYLYNYTKSPSKTGEKVRKIMLSQYKNSPNGHCGNEDCGQMSSWYVLSALGFYPVNPSTEIYNLGIPFFKEIIINLENGKKFVIQGRNLSEKNIYIKDIYLNNRPLDRLFITHSEIMNGGNLTFDMIDRPKDERLSEYPNF